MDRRVFLGNAAIAAIGATGFPSIPALAAESKNQVVGLQVGAVSFYDEGVDKVLDEIQNDAGVNTLFIATFSYGRGIAGRQIPGQPLPDHGKQSYDTGEFRGGCYTRVNPGYFSETPFKNFRAPELGDFDVLDAVLPAAQKRGLKTICWFEDVFAKNLPGIDALQEKEFSGQNAATLCFNNPYYRAWLLAMVENWARTYPIDGIMWGSERQGAFGNMLGSNYNRAGLDHATCFCAYCIENAKTRGIDPERARKGFAALDAFVQAGHAAQRPTDGYYVTFWRLLLTYPELLAWETLWNDSLRETYAAIYARAKQLNPKLQVGWHIWHNNSFSPIYRAEQDLARIAPVSDFLKIVMYHNCGGERFANYIKIAGSSLYADIPAQQLLDFHYRVLNYDELPLAEIPAHGLSSDYVYRETKRAKAALDGSRTLLLPGIDIDIPTAPQSSKCTPEGTAAAVEAAFKGGADGVILSRKYSEMKLTNLKGARQALRKIGQV